MIFHQRFYPLFQNDLQEKRIFSPNFSLFPRVNNNKNPSNCPIPRVSFKNPVEGMESVSSPRSVSALNSVRGLPPEFWFIGGLGSSGLTTRDKTSRFRAPLSPTRRPSPPPPLLDPRFVVHAAVVVGRVTSSLDERQTFA